MSKDVCNKLEEIIREDAAEEYGDSGVVSGWMVIAEVMLPDGSLAMCNYWSDNSGLVRVAGWLRDAVIRNDKKLGLTMGEDD